MKKSQILAALALAFALGVVAPVVNVTSVYAEDAVLTASECSVDMAIAKVENYALYQKYAALRELVAEQSTLGSDVGAVITALRSNVAYLGETPTSTISDNISVIKSYKGGYVSPVYTYWETLYNALEDVDNTTVSDLVAAARAIDGGFTSAETTVAGVVGDIQSDSTIMNSYNGGWRVIISTVKTAESVQLLRNRFMTTLSGWGNAAALATANDNSTESTSSTVLAQLAAYAQALPAYQKWADLSWFVGEIAAGKAATTFGPKTEDESATNKAIVNNINNLFKDATKNSNGKYVMSGSAPYSYTTSEAGVEVSLSDLSSIAGVCDNAADEDNTFTGDDTTTPGSEVEDGKDGANAPAAGALAKADATAKATVSIMAAIASVATAAFVAIRKIAASKKA